MAAALVLLGLGVAALPGLLRPFGRRVAAAEWAQLSFIAVIGSVVMVETGLILIAAPTVLRRLGIGALADACDSLIGPLVPLGSTGGWAAAALAVTIGVLAVRGWTRARSRLANLAIEPYLGEHTWHEDHEVVVLATDAHIAYSVDVCGPQVVLSQGLINSLSACQLQAVIDHEVAHLRHDHPRMLLLAVAARSGLVWWPPMRHSHRAFRVSVERWADEAATGTSPERRRELCDALLTVAAVGRPMPIATFTLADATAERVAAMEAKPVAPWALRAALYLPGVIAAAITLAVTGTWFSQTQSVLAMAGRCPI